MGIGCGKCGCSNVLSKDNAFQQQFLTVDEINKNHISKIETIQKHIRRYLSMKTHKTTDICQYNTTNSTFVYNQHFYNTKSKHPSFYTGFCTETNVKSGIGILKWKDGTEYKGEFYNNTPNGYGIIHYTTGEEYEGEWKDGKADGIGILRSIISDEYEVLYEGEWKEDIKEGIGVCEEKSIGNKTVRRFEGMYENGMKNGFGTYKSSDGEYFEGFFKDNTMNGYGLFRKGDGDEYEGFFQNNKKEGKGVFTCKDGSVFKGMYRKDIKNGKGEFIYPNGNVFSGKWVNGKKQGIGKVQKANGGSVKYGEWDQGTRIKWLSEEEVKNYISVQEDLNNDDVLIKCNNLLKLYYL